MAQWGVWNGDPPPMGSGGCAQSTPWWATARGGPRSTQQPPPCSELGREAGHVPVAATRLPGAGFVTVLEACDLGDFVVTVMLLLTHCERRGRVSGTLRTPGRAHALTRLGRATRSRASGGPRAHAPRVVSPKTPSSGRWGEQSKVAPGVPGAEVGELRPAPLISL